MKNALLAIATAAAVLTAAPLLAGTARTGWCRRTHRRPGRPGSRGRDTPPSPPRCRGHRWTVPLPHRHRAGMAPRRAGHAHRAAVRL